MTKGTNSVVQALAASDNDIYAGGLFDGIGDISIAKVAKWDGSKWNALGNGVYKSVNAIEVVGSDVYVGGGLFSAGNTPVDGLAKWNGSQWSSVGSIVGEVNSLAQMDGDLYAGGQFGVYGIAGTQNIAKWNGTKWEALGDGRTDRVKAMAAMNGKLYVLSQDKGLAIWGGTSWTETYGTKSQWYSIKGNTLAALNGDLYIGGDFTFNGDVAASNIVRWDGDQCHPLGSGVAKPVNSITVVGNDLYVGGEMKWDGQQWHALGSGLNKQAYASVSNGNYLYVGGDFTIAGGKAAGFLARWQLEPAGEDDWIHSFEIHPSMVDGEPAMKFTFQMEPGYDYTVEKNNDLSLASGWASLPASPHHSGQVADIITIPHCYYRLQRVPQQ